MSDPKELEKLFESIPPTPTHEIAFNTSPTEMERMLTKAPRPPSKLPSAKSSLKRTTAEQKHKKHLENMAKIEAKFKKQHKKLNETMSALSELNDEIKKAKKDASMFSRLKNTVKSAVFGKSKTTTGGKKSGKKTRRRKCRI